VDVVVSQLENLNPWQRAAHITVTHVFDSPILATLVSKGKITPREFAVAYLTTQCINSKIWGGTDREEESRLLEEITRDIGCILNYIELFSPQLSEIERLIKQGETAKLEFKSTLRWNLHSNKADNRIEHAVLKTIVAFLNTDGGTLLVGISDQGDILGTEPDHFRNSDKYLLHFGNLLNTSIGKKHLHCIKYAVVPCEDKEILRVECKSSPEPVYLKKGGVEEFFIRTGPSTVQLSLSEVVDYSKKHFQ
jgi:hypothetical protein